MNNSQFRQLISGSAKDQNGASGATPRPNAAPGALGTKRSSFVPMTPRSTTGGGVDFARQMRERNAAAFQPSQVKKFKSSAPKGVKYGAGYTDRAKARADDEGDAEAKDKAERVKALEEQMKLGQISQEMFEALRDKITGGEAGSTHLVKGLDWQLLERVRRGEDVMGTSAKDDVAEGEGEEEPEADVDDELEKLGEKDVEAVKKEKVAKKGNMAPPPPVAGKKRTRDEIMAELKAQRQAAAEAKKAAEPNLGDRWAKASDKNKPKFEIDEKGREVMITVVNGVVKKRVRKQPVATEQANAAMGAPDASKAVLGADASMPEPPKPEEPIADPADNDDDDIFEGVGTDYNPLANMPDDDSDDDSDDSDAEAAPPRKKPTSRAPSTDQSEGEVSDTESSKEAQPSAAAATITTKQPPARRNYFNDGPSTTEDNEPSHLAGIQEVLKKAAKMDPLNSDPNDDSSESPKAREARIARAKRHAQMLANQDRDLEDMDMGFGGSRFDDAGGDDEDGQKVKLAEWKGGDDGWEEGEEGAEKGAGGKRKRKPKKRKGDASSMGDIMRVIEGRKGEGKK
ncbi:hypothetical protein Q7P37_005002 [Cladosporium fusiforme]